MMVTVAVDGVAVGTVDYDHCRGSVGANPAAGQCNDDIATQLYISPQTVQTHVRNILGKLRVHSKLEAVAFAVKHGVIQVT